MHGGDILCHPVLVPSYLHDFDDANDKVGADRNPFKTEVVYYVADLDAAPPKWKLDEVRKLASVSTVAAGSTSLGVAVGPRQFIATQILFEQCTNVFSCAKTCAVYCGVCCVWLCIVYGVC